jgi:SNF-related kinase
LGKNKVPKISDFGFAITPNTAKKMPNINVGSPLYMSPQALKMSRYSDKSDIWAIGVTAYELLFGQVPWQATSEADLANKMVTT